MFIFTLCALGGSDAHLQNAHKPKAHHTHCLMLQITVNQNNIYENLSLSGMCVYIYIYVLVKIRVCALTVMESERSSSDPALLMLLVEEVELVEFGILGFLVISPFRSSDMSRGRSCVFASLTA